MSTALFEAILAYATIPVYVIGLLILVSIIARSQLGFSLSDLDSPSTPASQAQEHQKTSFSSYLVVMLVFAAFIFLTIADQRSTSHEH